LDIKILNKPYMKNYIIITLSSLILLGMVACRGENGITAKKAELESLKREMAEISSKIKTLEEEIALSGDSSKANEKSKIVGVSAVKFESFNKYIDVQGYVDGDENVTLSAKVPSTVTKVLVNAGDRVKVGQVLATLDGDIVKTQLKDLETNLKFVTELYNKQKALWDKGVGSEVQFLSAKNNKESLEQKLATLKENLDMYLIKSPINGTIDEVMLKVGQASVPGYPAFRVVNFSKLKVKADLAETYAAEVKSGNDVILQFPDIKKELKSTLRYSGRSINLLNRTFGIEADLPSSEDFIPNMVAVVKVVSYHKEKAIVVPINLVQDSEGKKVIFIADAISKKAMKKEVIVGNIYNGKAEITSGLNEGDQIIIAGYQDLNDQESIKY
jgi:RND family efflux transporter MFP subunit